MLCNINDCVSCGACENVCPVNAIQLEYKDGFLKPLIDAGTCVKCGACSRACPVLADKLSERKRITPAAYAAYINDETIMKSASGGLFRNLAEYILDHGGVVFGAVMKSDLNVYISMIDNIDKLDSMQGSKYVQSITGESYKLAKRELDSGRTVLYSGLPCQVGGLLTYLGKDHDNLITVDIVCHGAPSPQVFKKYIESYEAHNKCHVVKVEHRYKRDKWTKLIQPTPAYFIENKDMKIYSWQNDAYLRGFLSGLYYKKSCYSCRFASMPRCSDITLGDFFGLGVIKPFKHKCEKGISQVIVNTKKGKGLFESIKSNIFCEERSLYECMMFNHNLWKPSSQPAARDEFYCDLNNMSWDELEKKYLESDVKSRLMLTIKSAVKKILGPHLVAAGMYTVYKIKGIDKKVNNITKLRCSPPL